MVQKMEMNNTPVGCERKILSSWKEIASYTGRAVRTLQRYERQLGLPVHRLPGPSATSIFAFSDEVDAWLRKAPVLREQRLRHHNVCPMCSGTGVLGVASRNSDQPVPQATRRDGSQPARSLPMRSSFEKGEQTHSRVRLHL
jgi:hypothetical protein